jgi:hypothetical protein
MVGDADGRALLSAAVIVKYGNQVREYVARWVRFLYIYLLKRRPASTILSSDDIYSLKIGVNLRVRVSALAAFVLDDLLASLVRKLLTIYIEIDTTDNLLY